MRMASHCANNSHRSGGISSAHAMQSLAIAMCEMLKSFATDGSAAIR
jgi:hypothetical protein